MGVDMDGGQVRDALVDRTTMCVPNYTVLSVVQAGEDGFSDALHRCIPSDESNALERLVHLKSELRQASTREFWELLLQEICEITGAQCGIACKRILVDDDESAVEMPELSQDGPCLMGIATYMSNGGITAKSGYQYRIEGAPCPCMRHNKVCIVPERFSELYPHTQNIMPDKPSEAFIGIPLFHDGKCFASFGVIWDSEGAKRRKLGWGFIEMLLHSLEDMILQRILEGRGFAKDAAQREATPVKVIPISAISPSQSLKPYAQSLSHELRTPMQGVVGMLDIMYATVLDAITNQQNDWVRAVFVDLKSHIELVQGKFSCQCPSTLLTVPIDSSKRAVEAADNVVHACDLNMQMPETPLTPTEPGGQSPSMPAQITSRTRSSSESWSAPTSGSKRSSRHGAEPDFQSGRPPKRMFKMTETEILNTFYHVGPRASSISGPCIATAEQSPTSDLSGFHFRSEIATPISKSVADPAVINGAQRHISTREFVRSLVNTALRTAHPTSEVHTETGWGETIKVLNLGTRGEMQKRTIYLKIESDVPEVIVTDVQHLQFPIQKVIDNAIKFTESGSITITVQLGKQLQVVDILVADTGCGITEESKHSLFTPHFQEDASLSRSRDGLGLSLFNAKAHVRKALGGDVTLERSATDGPSKGSEFLIRLPISSVEAGSTHPPLVGIPTPSGPPCCRPEPPPHQGLSSPLTEPTPSFPVTPPRQRSPNPSPRRRVAFNRHLAEEYPLNILIAEDNSINRHVAIGSLNKLGYSKDRITVAIDGVEAVQHFAASLAQPLDQRFDAILMDIWMPNMDGFQAMERIMDLAKEEGTLPKIIAVTADITGGCIDRAKASGMHGFLAKPYKVLDIEHLILQHFGKT
jgi:signal transduction histidine kinase